LKTVLAKKGSMLTISGNITCNMSQVKKVNPKLEIAPPEDANEIEVAWPQTSNAGSPSESESVPKDLVSEKPRVRRSERTVKTPAKFKDYVLNK
jgi:hypothetical protein